MVNYSSCDYLYPSFLPLSPLPSLPPSPPSRVEEERREDLERRDALAERLKLKDAEKTRKIMERSDKKVF